MWFVWLRLEVKQDGQESASISLLRVPDYRFTVLSVLKKSLATRVSLNNAHSALAGVVVSLALVVAFQAHTCCYFSNDTLVSRLEVPTGLAHVFALPVAVAVPVGVRVAAIAGWGKSYTGWLSMFHSVVSLSG